jgi:hypothetical protein
MPFGREVVIEDGVHAVDEVVYVYIYIYIYVYTAYRSEFVEDAVHAVDEVVCI